MNTTNSLSNTSLSYNRGGYSIKNDSVTISANRFQMLKSALIKLMLVMAIVVGGKVAWGETTGTIVFGSASGSTNVNSASVSGSDSQGNTWAITTDGTTSFTPNASYSQIGSSNSPATSITFTTTLPSSVNITSMSAKFGGFKGTAGTITLKVGSTTIGSGSLSATSDVTVNSNSSATGNVLTVTVTNISKGVKVYYIEYTYTAGNSHTLFSAVDPVGAGTVVLSSTTIAEGSTATATANPNSGYVFDHWSISGTGASLSSTSANPTTVTMGTTNATVTAHFTEIPKYEITFNNGTGTLSTLTEEYGGAGIVLPSETAPYCNSPSYIFYGWAEEEVSNPSIVPTIVGMTGNRYFPSRNTTLYAVYATVSEYSKVTSSPDYEDKTGIYLIVCENDGVAFDGRKDPLDVSSNNVGVTISNNTIASNNTIDSISFYFFNIENNYTIRSSSGKFIGRDSDSNGLDSDASTEYSNAISFSSGNANIVSGGAYLRYNYTSGQNRFRYYKSTTYTGQRAIQLYKAVATYTSEPLCASATVIYDANGATGGDVPIDSNSPYPLVNGQRNIELLYNTGNLVKTGYTFDGWNIEADGSGSSYSEGDTFTLTENTILYAKWNPNNYTISWRVNGLSDGDYTYPYNTLIPDGDVPSDESTLEYVCDDKTFVGWSETASELFDGVPTLLQRNQIVNTAVTGNKTYYAVFAKRTGGSEYWNLVTDDSDLHSGDVVVITSNVEGKVAGDISSQIMSAVTSSFSGTGSGSTITSLGDGAIQLTLEENLGEWTISNGNGEKLGATAAKKLAWDSGTMTWSISISNGEATIENTEASYGSFLYNVNSPRFTTYTSSPNANMLLPQLYKLSGGYTYSNYTTFCPCNYGTITDIANGDMVWAGKNVGAEWNDKDNWVVYNNSGEPKYHLATEAPSTENNVFVVQKGECGITVSPNISENITCGNLTMFNGLSLAIADNQTLTINGTATFTSGIINGNVIFGSGATVSDASANSYVNGKVTKNDMSGAFTFPTGTASLYAPFEASSSAASNVSAQYAAGSEGMPDWWNHSGNLYDAGLNHASDRENWQISASASTTLSDIKLYWNAAADNYHSFEEDASDLNSYLNVAVVKKNGFYWQNLGKASIDGSFTGAGSITAAEPLTITVGAKAAGDGEYFATFASSNSNVVLPIELISFTAICNGKSSLIEWTTATEKNNDFFVLERSHDAVNFKEIARIAGAGNSIEPISYAYTDFGVRNGDNYYRLVQVDYDGTSTASEIIVANCLGTDGEPEVLAYPNPFGDDITLRFENFGNIQATVEVYDMLGRMVHTQKINCSQNDYEVVLRLAGLSDGTYNVRISAKEFVLNKKVVKQ